MTRPLIPGVPAAGHISAGGFWHPSRVDGCPKCPPPPVRYRMCERTTATPTSPIHIRALTPGETVRLGGGVNTVTLCGAPLRGWDVSDREVDTHDISDRAIGAPCGRTCASCAGAWARRPR